MNYLLADSKFAQSTPVNILVRDVSCATASVEEKLQVERLVLSNTGTMQDPSLTWSGGSQTGLNGSVDTIIVNIEGEIQASFGNLGTFIVSRTNNTRAMLLNHDNTEGLIDAFGGLTLKVDGHILQTINAAGTYFCSAVNDSRYVFLGHDNTQGLMDCKYGDLHVRVDGKDAVTVTSAGTLFPSASNNARAVTVKHDNTQGVMDSGYGPLVLRAEGKSVVSIDTEGWHFQNQDTPADMVTITHDGTEAHLDSANGRLLLRVDESTAFSMGTAESFVAGRFGVGAICPYTDTRMAFMGTTPAVAGLSRGLFNRETLATTANGNLLFAQQNSPYIMLYHNGSVVQNLRLDGYFSMAYSCAEYTQLCVDRPYMLSSAGSCTTAYGVYINGPNHGGTNWALYIASGAAYIASGAWTPSDRRLKQDIQAVDTASALQTLERLSVKTFRYTPEHLKCTQLPDREYTGLIAQEVKQVMPELVEQKYMNFKYTEPKAAAMHIDGEECKEAEDKEEEICCKMEDCHLLQSQELVFTLIAAVQELSARVRALEAR